MSNITTTSDSVTGSFSITGATTATIFNVAVPLANTEVSQALSAGTKRFTIKVRGGTAKLQLSFTTLESGTKFLTVPKGCSYSEDLLGFSGTLFFQTNVASQTVEIVEWS